MFKRATGTLLPPPLIYLLFLGAAWLLDALLPLVIFSMQRGVIVHEEKLLAELFGEDYSAYCGRVRRCL